MGRLWITDGSVAWEIPGEIAQLYERDEYRPWCCLKTIDYRDLVNSYVPGELGEWRKKDKRRAKIGK